MKIWIWASPDGDYLASSRRNAMAKVEEVYPGGTWTKTDDGDMKYAHSLLGGDEDDDDPGPECFVVGCELNGWR